MRLDQASRCAILRKPNPKILGQLGFGLVRIPNPNTDQVVVRMDQPSHPH